MHSPTHTTSPCPRPCGPRVVAAPARLRRATSIAAGLLALACSPLLPAPAVAATSFVSTSGSDANPGTESSPWRTIQKAADTMKAGDTVIVQPGRYDERVTTKVHGSETAPITFKAASREATVGAFAVSHAYIVIDGFTLTAEQALAYQGSVTAFEGGDNLTVRNCLFAGGKATTYQFLIHASGTRATHAVVEDNEFRDVIYMAVSLASGGSNTGGHVVRRNFFTSPHGADAIRINASNVVVADNVFQNWSNLVGTTNHPDLIQAFNNTGATVAQDVVIERNIAIDCVKAQIGNISNKMDDGSIARWIWRNNIFVNVEYKMSIFAPDFHFFNNVFYRSGRNSGHPIMFEVSPTHGSGHNGRVFNNIFYECGSRPESAISGWYFSAAGLNGFQADHNLVIGTGAGTEKKNFQRDDGREMRGFNGIDPMFVNPADHDYRLKPGSPALGAALALRGIFDTDFSGTARGARWDIGAFQHQVVEGSLRPLAPGPLSSDANASQ